jgi:hypothetical protein
MVTKNILALGDSHLDALKLASELELLNGNYYFSIVPGATAVGLRNPNSITDAVNIFTLALATQPTDSHVIIHLGEVDCGFVIWWRAQKYGESIEKQFGESIDAYGQFLNVMLQRGFNKICIAGASLPTIPDRVEIGDVANKRSEINVSIKDRTELTIKYNRALKELAKKLGISYFDITDAVLNQSSKVVHDFFRNPDSSDHHLDQQKTVGIWASKCNSFVDGLI